MSGKLLRLALRNHLLSFSAVESVGAAAQIPGLISFGLDETPEHLVTIEVRVRRANLLQRRLFSGALVFARYFQVSLVASPTRRNLLRREG